MNDKTTSSRGRPALSKRAKPTGRSALSARREAIIASKAPTLRRGRKTAEAVETPKSASVSEDGPNRRVVVDVASAADATAVAAAATEPAAAPVSGPANVDNAETTKAAESVEEPAATDAAPAMSEAAEAPVTPAEVAVAAAPEPTKPASVARPARKPRKAKAITEDPANGTEAAAAKPRRTKTTKAAEAAVTTRNAEPVEKPRAAKKPTPLEKPMAAAIVDAENPAATPRPMVTATRRLTPDAKRPQQSDFRIAYGTSSEAAVRLSNEIGAEMARFAEEAITAGSDGLLNAATAKSLPELFERQARSAKVAANLWMGHSSRIGAICMAAFGDIRGPR